MRRVTIYYPHCTIEGYVNEQGQFADKDGVILTITERIPPTRVVEEPGDLPDIDFVPPMEHVIKENINILRPPKKQVALAQIVSKLYEEEKDVDLKQIVNTLSEPEIEAQFVEILGVLAQKEENAELVEMLNSLPTKQKIELMELLGNMPVEEKEEVGEFTDVEIDDETQDILASLLDKYSY